MTKIYAPNKRYAGLIAGVSFLNGVGETDNKYLISWFGEKGYKVEDSRIYDIEQAYKLALEEDGAKELNKLTITELKSLLDEKGIEYNAKAKKDELIKLLEGE